MKNKRTALWIAFLVSAAFMAACQPQARVSVDEELRTRADELAQKLIIIDTHQDAPYRLRRKMQDISRRTKTGDFDYPRARQGGLDALFMAVFVPAEYQERGGAFTLADKTIDMIEGFAETWPDKFTIARSVTDVKRQFGDGRISIAMGMENGAPIEGNLANLKYFYDRGVRYITLVHSRNNHICDSSYDKERRWNGLSPFGAELVPEMNRVGMIIDVSHVSDEAFYQIIELSKAPVAATHSSCRHFTPGWQRNMDDDMIRLLAKNGGVIQVNFGSIFVSKQVYKKYVDVRKHIADYVETHNLTGSRKEQYIRKYRQEHPRGEADISDVVANIDHVVKLVGIGHVGLGSDFDGVGGHLPRGLEDVSCYPNLIYELLKKGYTEQDIKQICSDNFLRVWSEVQRTAVELQSSN